jgi:WD40 repeat protein
MPFPKATPVFSPNSQHCAYATDIYKTKTRCILSDGKEDQSFKTEELGDPVWTPNSKSYAYTVSEGGKVGDKWTLYWEHRKFGPYDMIEGITFSPNSLRVTFRALAREKWSVVVDYVKGPGFTKVSDIVFSPDGKHMAYAASDKDGWSVVCDENKGPAYAEVSDPVFSADGAHMAYSATKDSTCFVVCGKKRSADYEEAGSVFFSPNGNHVAFAAGRKNDKFIVIDGIESPPHKRVIIPERPCETQGKFRYVVIDKNEASLVEVDWPKGGGWEAAFTLDKK